MQELKIRSEIQCKEVKIFTIFQNFFFSTKRCYFELSIHKKKTYKSLFSQMFSTLILIRNVSWAENSQIQCQFALGIRLQMVLLVYHSKSQNYSIVRSLFIAI